MIGIMLAIGIFTLPWWCSFALMLFVVIIIPRYVESIPLILLFEAAYSPLVETPLGLMLPLTLLAVALLGIIEFMRGMLRERFFA